MQQSRAYRSTARGFPCWLKKQVDHLGYMGAWPLHNLPIVGLRWEKICNDGIILVPKETTLLPGFSEKLAKATAK